MPHVTFIHGISNKPPKDKLLKLWRDALAREGGIDLGASGVSSTMVYWADVMYAAPQDEQTAFESVAAGQSPDVAAAAAEPGVDTAWKQTLPGDEQAWLAKLEAKLKVEAATDEVLTAAQAVTPTGAAASPELSAEPTDAEDAASDYERIWLPAPIKKKIMEHFLRDVHHYLFNEAFSPRPGAIYRVQDEIRGRLVAALKEGAAKPGPHILVSHSMGTVISYDCLKRVADCPRVDALVTVGSPLGIDEVQDGFAPEYNRQDGFPAQKVGGRWVNVFDALDPVAGFDTNLANDYQKNGARVVEDIHEPNWGRWRHDITKYLQGPQLRGALKQLLGV
jgi:predicted alpha/beta hydrolase family esterase